MKLGTQPNAEDFEVFVSLAFLGDIAINFNTAYVRADATLVISKRAITVRHYPA